MELTKSRLWLVREALGYGIMFSQSEKETTEFALLLVDVEEAISDEYDEQLKEKENG